MPKRERKLLGKKGHAEIVEIFAAVSNTELNEGRGSPIDDSYHPNAKQAEVGAIGIGVMGSKGNVEPRLAVKFSDGTMLLLNNGDALPARKMGTSAQIKFSTPSPKQIAEARQNLARQRGAKKLTVEEKEALGIK